MGIGLSLVNNLVRMHNGSVEAYSAGLGKGSEFTVRLPVTPPLQKKPVPESNSQKEDSTSTPRRMLVVDDNEACAKTMGWTLERCGSPV